MEDLTIGKDVFRHYKQTYYVTNNGKVANIITDEEGYVINFRLMKLETSSFGHKRVELHINKEPIKFSIHRMVYEVWIGELIDGMVIEHLDGNPSNNNINNLKQSTQKENIETAIKQNMFNQRWSNNTHIIVYDKLNNTTKGYECIRDFLVDIDAPPYIIKHGSLASLNKRKEYKNRFVIEKTGRKGKGQQTTESVDSEKDAIE